MKKLYTIVVLALLCNTTLYSQGADCATADAFCTGNAYTFPASTSTTAESGPDYGCLGDQPNPAWYFLQIQTGGNITIDLTNSQDVDIDFICWGPFSNLTSACSNLTGGGVFSSCSLFETYPCGNIVDCSYSINADESCNITGAVAGQYYMFLITNFSGDPTDITASSTGSATTNCSIVPPPVGSCLITYFEANVSACGGNSEYSVDGSFTYSDNPVTGSVIVVVDNGTTTYTQTFNPPFVDGTSYSYDITGIPADGSPSTVSVYFTADPSCTQELSYTAPANCDLNPCTADVGSQSAAITGVSTNNYVLCYGDVIDFNVLTAMTPGPDEPTSTPPSTYDPGLGWMVYSCPPSLGVTPVADVDIVNDPCFLGYYTDGAFSDLNDMGWITGNPGVFTNNTVYFVPITMYSIQDLVYATYYAGIPSCYDMGTPFAVQYLPQITMTQTTSCATGQVTATVTGGLPAVNGSQFTVVAGSLTPASATFVNTTCNNAGNIVLGGLTSGQAYSFDVEDANGCPITVAGTMTGAGGATLSYPSNAFCVNAANPSPTVTGSASGTFSSTAGLSINSSTGVINLAASTPGPYTVTYVGTGGTCPPSATFNLTVNALPTVDAGPDQTICQGQQVTLTGSGANLYGWNNGVNNGVPFTPAATATYTVTGTSLAGCVNTDDVVVTVDLAGQPVFSANITSGCSPLTVTFTNVSGGSNCSWDFGDGTTGTGCATIIHQYTAVGCYDVTLTTASATGCVGSATQADYICVTPDPVASFNATPSVMTTMNTTASFNNNSTNANTYLWNFGDETSSTVFEPNHTYPQTAANYTIELIAYSISGCRDTAYGQVVINEEIVYYVPNTFTPDGDENNQNFVPVFTSGFDPYNFNMKIFDRWGEIIFETNNVLIGWDGTYQDKLVKDGTYTWKIEFKTSTSDARKVAVGHVNVLR